ncbi:MAG: hypothetical protein KKF44_05895 [Nanoarchaeota archaeon]|nr:hypothetical protein [Nanoarchaeota archaeon]
MIYINSHEPADLVNLIKCKADVTVKNFCPGDFIVGKIGIERKTFDDYLCSLASGRLFTQLVFLKEIYPKSFLVIEEIDLSVISNQNYFFGSIAYILMDLDVKIIFSNSKEQTSEILSIISQKENKIRSRILADHFLRYKKKHRKQEKIRLLADLLEIGDGKAKILLQSFSSLSELLSVDKKAEIKGIGKKTIGKIIDLNRKNFYLR